MIDTNIIEKEYDIKDSQCNFRGQGVGGRQEGAGGARAKGLIGQGGGGWNEGLWAARISLAIIKGGETRGAVRRREGMEGCRRGRGCLY